MSQPSLDTIVPLLTSFSSLEVERGFALLKEAASPAIYEKLLEGLKLPQVQKSWRLDSFHLSPCLACETEDQKALARLAVMRATMEAEVSSPALDSYRSVLGSIKKLVLHMPSLFQDLSALRCLSQVEWLFLQGQSIMDFSFLSSLEKLHFLELYECGFVEDLEMLGQNKNLQGLRLTHCKNLQDISALSRLPSLTELDLDNCPQVQGYEASGSLTHLRVLWINHIRAADTSALCDLSWAASLANLETLALKYCDGLRDISGIAGLARLTSLELTGCSVLEEFEALHHLPALKKLTIASCKHLANRDFLRDLHGLESLSISECGALNDVSSLSGLSEWRKLGW